ncbi:MAG: LysR substrate-binding domain-containing protein [Hyphomicrobiaceae bacterium]
MMNITLKQLRYFEALARHTHFGRAADACAVTQPALSMQIKELEQTLGVALFERTARRVQLTGVGEELLDRSRDILRRVDELVDLASSAQGSLLGRLRLGVIPTVAPYLLPSIVGRLTEHHNGLDLHVRETLTSTLITEIMDGRLDAAIVALPVSEPALVEVPIFSEGFVFVRPSGDAGKPVPDRTMLKDMRVLLLEEGHCFRDQALSFCNLGSGQPRELLDASSLSTLVQMVGAGIGVTLVPEMAVAVETRSADVSVIRFKAPEPTRTIGLIWRRTSPISPQLRRLSEDVRAAAQEHASQPQVAHQLPLRSIDAAT